MAEHDSPPAAAEGCTEAQVEMLALYLKCTTECMEGVRKLPSPKFYNRQCEYLVEKLQKFVRIAGVVLDRLGSCLDAERRIEVLKLALVLAKRIESFVKSCSDDSFIQAAMGLTNTSKYVASIGFDLELCRIALCKDDGCTARLTLDQVQAKYEDEVKEVEKKVLEDVEILFNKVLDQLSKESLKKEIRQMASYLLRKLKRIYPTAPCIPSESLSYSVMDDKGILRAMYQLVSHSTKMIGKGGSATVYKARWLGTKVAKKTFGGRENPEFMAEAEILARLNHPNITSMFCCEKDWRSSSIIMEIMDGDLYTLMLERCRRAGCDNPPFTIFEALDIMLQISEGVNYLHGEGICHRDLKSLNILVKSMLTPQSEVEVGYVHAKVADFGLSKTKNSTTHSDLTLNTGSSRWMAPEIIASDGRRQGNSSSQQKHPPKIDVHSFAMLCYEILTGCLPYEGEEPSTVRDVIKRGIRPELPNNCPFELKALIQECWDEIPRERPPFPVICSKLKYVKYLLMTGFCSSEDTEASTSVESEATKPKIYVSYNVEPPPPFLEVAPSSSSSGSGTCGVKSSALTPSVIVIGAGFGGLAAARFLHNSNLKVVVLESRDRIGGRVYTDYSFGFPVDMGASWLHGVCKDNPLAPVIGKLRLPLYRTSGDNSVLYDHDLESYALFDMDGHQVPQTLVTEVGEVFENLLEETKKLRDEHPDDMSVLKAFILVLDRRPDLRQEGMAFKVLQWYLCRMEGWFAADADNISVQSWDEEELLQGGHGLMVKGYQPVISSLAAGLDIRLNHRVTKVNRSLRGVGVTTEDGKVFEADACVVAIPLGVLKANLVRFEPRLPEWKEAAIADLGVGNKNKIALFFEKVCWPNVEFLGVVAPTSYGCSYFLNLHKATGHPVLVYMPAGRLANDIEQLSNEAAANFAIRHLKRILPNAAEPIQYLVSRWGKDLSSLGCYSYDAVGKPHDLYERLRTPVDNLFWAGEATSERFPGTVHGAFATGVMAGNECLKRFAERCRDLEIFQPVMAKEDELITP